MIAPGHTLIEAREYVGARLDAGVTCPCCDQYVRRYRRKLNANMIQFLISLYRWGSVSPWVDYRKCRFRGRDYNYLAHWGLAELQPNDDTKKKASGLWRITPEGAQFALRRIVVPKYLYFLNNAVVGKSDELTDVLTALGSQFNYQELMTK